MKNHPFAALFNESLDKNNPLYEQIKGDFKILRVIELNFSIDGQYKTTDEIANDYRKLIVNKTRLTSVKGDEAKDE